jgi:hypothetical protein
MRHGQRAVPLRCLVLVVWAPSLASAFGRLGNLFTRQAAARALEEDADDCADSADPGAAQCKIWADAGERHRSLPVHPERWIVPCACYGSRQPAELESGSQASELWHHRTGPLTVAAARCRRVPVQLRLDEGALREGVQPVQAQALPGPRHARRVQGRGPEL